MPRPPWRRLPVTTGLLALSVGIAGLMASAAPVTAASHGVQIADSAFGPTTLAIAVGDTVTWTNADDRPHTVTAESGAFDSGNLDAGGSFSVTFTEPGTYTYRCEYHPDMQATLVVQSADAAPAAPAPAQGRDEGTAQAPGGGATHTGVSGGTASGGDQPDTALPAPWSLPGMSFVLWGLGLMAIAIGVAPRRRAASVVRRLPGGWRR